ncbi:WecB/TagA/CpsF family glycosyltransferase [Pinisolibacter aquiterrae]|uniref:WecB/TagA/CpsF family glycosyltransferase n=1 Tax=Pinisolibacter aquiterrae TaxID=2815579 RepID=UPI001C3CFC17|nr:WecB/TagA/CpsF family glycosyltransferase [Pinisolibacter aquiterrae]MBV5264741.1 WecB/TagA/CpsF family glycosyltransferase [Pinisolibacter aquiterrae]MCC8237088.1 WecB/TagA/CpsF family glycosyltransferase [Pinisolibacter aquiterrae]
MINAATIEVMNLPILNTTSREAIELLNSSAAKTGFFVNAHCVNVASKDPVYRWALGKADHLLPDGIGMKIAARAGGDRLVENLNGTDLFVPLVRDAAARHRSIFFFGAAPGIAEAAAAKATELAPGLRIAGCRDGYFSPNEEDGVIRAINASGADIVLVALGVPRQEIWIARNRPRLNAGLVMGVGAQFDFWSGRVRRAPAIVRRLSCEWAWRLALEPRRLARRYLVGNPLFLARVAARKTAEAVASEPGRLGKRLLDVALAGSAVVALSPVLLAIAAAIRTTSPGPVLFRQERVGEGGRRFTMLKFRSMCNDAERRLDDLRRVNTRAGVCLKAAVDPRITPVGRFLRRFSLDELPQLFNVLRGEMSIVGPRPALPREVAAYPPEAMERLVARPGLTGVWQVSGRADVAFDKMVGMDVAYGRSRSLLLDVALIGLTVRAVFGGRGAY